MSLRFGFVSALPAMRSIGFLFLTCLSSLSVRLSAEDAAVLTAPDTLRPGSQSSCTLTILDARDQHSISRQATVRLISVGGGEQYLLFSGLVQGQRRIEFQVPETEASGLLLTADVVGISEQLEIMTAIERTPAILIETDKPIYKPSQTIQGRIILLSSRLRPIEDDVEVTIHDAKGIRVARFRLESDRYGVAPFSLELASELNLGTWKVRARSHQAAGVRDIRVEEYTLPRFELAAKFDRPWALVDEPVQGTVTARYFFGKEVEGEARIRARRWVGVWEEYASAEGTLLAGGWSFELPPVGFLTGTATVSGQGTIVLDISVVDSTGHEQQTTEVLTITEAPVILTVVPASPNLKPGIPSSMAVQTATPDGHPLDQMVSLETRFYSWDDTLIESRRDQIQTREGSANLFVLPPRETAYAVILASTVRDGHTTDIETRIGSAYSSSRSFLSVNRVGSGAVSLGDLVRFSTLSTEPGTVYYEVYAAGRTVLSDATEEESFSFTATRDMIPRAKVVAYRLGTNNEVAADSVSFSVELPVSLTLAAGFSADQVRPGDPVEVVLDTGTNRPTLLGLSIVDESVLALGNSRLHLADVFEELERRFLQPQIEIHDNVPPVDPPPGFHVESPGAIEVLQDVGLEIAATQNVLLSSGRNRDFFLGGPPLDLSPAPSGGGVGSAQIPPRLRQFFPETWLWEPTLLTDESGRATLTLTAPDSITGWKLAVVGTCPDLEGDDPGIRFGETELTVFQDFFVEPQLPYSVVRGETFEVKIDLFNYLARPQMVALEIEKTPGIELLGDSSLTTRIDASSAASVNFLIRPAQVGEFPLKLTAIGESAADAVLRPLKVIAEGLPLENVQNGVISPGTTLPLALTPLPEMVEDSLRAFLYLSPSPVAQAMNGVSDLLGMPYGCGEQNMIFLAPDIEVLRYLRETGELAPEIRAEAEHFINVGYQRQLTYRSDDHGFSAFGGETGSLWLTAFVLSTFSGAREVRDIDEAVLAGAALMLISRQLGDGSFETDDFLIHKEMDGGLENHFSMAAYVAKALAEYGDGEVATALSRAAEFLASNLTQVWHDPYSLAIGAVALQQIAGYERAAESAVDRLLELAEQDETGIHWEPYPVETTGYAAIALLRADSGRSRPQAQGAIEWLSTQRNSLGGYGGSTQDTVVALRALFEVARKMQRDLDVELTVLQGEKELRVLRIDEFSFDLLQQVELPIDGEPLSLRSVGTGNVGFQWVQRYNVPGTFLPPSSDLLLDVSYGTDHVEVDDLVDVEVRLLYTGLKQETGMVILDVGVPTGFEAEIGSLEALKDGGQVKRFEMAGRKLIFYIDSLFRDEELTFRFLVRALFPVRAEGPISRAYEYYDSQVKAFDRWEDLEVGLAGPQIEAISAEKLAPGQQVVITGSGLGTGLISVKIGGILVESYEVVDENTVVVTVPRLPEGEVEIVIETAAGSVTWNRQGSLETTETVLYFPLYPRRREGFSGFAAVNHSDQPAALEFEMLDEEGGLLDMPRNPARISLPAGRQMALLGSEIFGYSASKGPAWVEMTSDNPDVSGYALFGGFHMLDNLGGLRFPSRRLYFTRIPASLSDEDGVSHIALANPGFTPSRVLLRLSATNVATGAPVKRSLPQTIPGRGVFGGNPLEFFGINSPLSDIWISVQILDGPGVVGYELVEFPGSSNVVGLGPQELTPLTELYAAHVVHSQDVRTTLNLVNVSDKSRSVSLAAFGENAKPLRPTRIIQLEPGEVLRQGLDQALLLAEGETLQGFLRVKSDGPGVLGDVLLMDARQKRYATGYNLQRQKLTQVVLSQLANGVGMFTGVAILNPAPRSAEVRLEVFTAEGNLLGSRQLTLEAGCSLVRLLTELVPESEGAIGGYLTILSTEPILVQEILGEEELNYFSTVVPAPIR